MHSSVKKTLKLYETQKKFVYLLRTATILSTESSELNRIYHH